MEELKMLVEMVASLPQMALWVLIGFWAYKVVVVGSIYGVIRFGIDRLHSWLTKPKHELVTHDVRLMLDGEVITGAREALLAQIRRVRERSKSGKRYAFVFQDDVDWLREAISEKLEREGEAE
jgi:hypothetical protein